MEISLDEAYAEACKLLGMEMVKNSLLISKLNETDDNG